MGLKKIIDSMYLYVIRDRSMPKTITLNKEQAKKLEYLLQDSCSKPINNLFTTKPNGKVTIPYDYVNAVINSYECAQDHTRCKAKEIAISAGLTKIVNRIDSKKYVDLTYIDPTPYYQFVKQDGRTRLTEELFKEMSRYHSKNEYEYVGLEYTGQEYEAKYEKLPLNWIKLIRLSAKLNLPELIDGIIIEKRNTEEYKDLKSQIEKEKDPTLNYDQIINTAKENAIKKKQFKVAAEIAEKIGNKKEAAELFLKQIEHYKKRDYIYLLDRYQKKLE